MVNRQAELIDSPELSPGHSGRRPVGAPAAAVRDPMLVPQGGREYQVTVAEPEYLRAEGQARLCSAEIPDQRLPLSRLGGCGATTPKRARRRRQP